MSIHPIAGIDYGNSKTNIDTTTGIRYGVIRLHSINDSFDYFSPVYDEDADEFSDPVCFEYSDEGFELRYNPDSSFIWVFKSPYVTECKFCSPCVPGAGDLDNPIKDGIKTYCLDSSWFENKTAPYPYTKI
jgi:hypothetical protein